MTKILLAADVCLTPSNKSGSQVIDPQPQQHDDKLTQTRPTAAHRHAGPTPLHDPPVSGTDGIPVIPSAGFLGGRCDLLPPRRRLLPPSSSTPHLLPKNQPTTVEREREERRERKAKLQKYTSKQQRPPLSLSLSPFSTHAHHHYWEARPCPSLACSHPLPLSLLPRFSVRFTPLQPPPPTPRIPDRLIDWPTRPLVRVR